MRALVVRHGETDENLRRCYLGRRDPPLNATGRRQAEEVARRVAAFSPTRVYVSGLQRARETAAAVAKALGQEVVPAPALVEMDVGALDGLLPDEAAPRFPEFFAEWRTRPATCRMPGGETLAEVQARAWGFLEECAARHGDEPVVFVTHTFVVLALVCRVLGLPLDGFRRLYVETGSLTILNVDERAPALLALNLRP